MFSIGLPEIGIIFLVLILCVKPEDIPNVFHTLGRWYHHLRRVYTGVTDEFRELSYQLDAHSSTNTKSSPTKSEDSETLSSASEEMGEPVGFSGHLKS